MVLDFPGVVDAELVGEFNLVKRLLKQLGFVTIVPRPWKLMLVEYPEFHGLSLCIFDQPAAVTARCAITLIRLARYDEEPWISVNRPSAEIVTLSRPADDPVRVGGAPMAGTRIPPFWDAPVAAPLPSPDLVFATNTPVRAK